MGQSYTSELIIMTKVMVETMAMFLTKEQNKVPAK